MHEILENHVVTIGFRDGSKKKYLKDCQVLKLSKPVEAIVLNMLVQKPCKWGKYKKDSMECMVSMYSTRLNIRSKLRAAEL